MSPANQISHNALLQLAIDMANSLSAKDRFDRLLNTVRGSIQCDAVVLLQRNGNLLKPLAQKGLTADVLGRRFTIDSQPRFQQICQTNIPTRFQTHCDLPDPYDGMLQGHRGDLPVHACMGLPLMADQQLIGVLTLDSMTPGAFDEIPEYTLEVISAMAAASLKTAMLLQHLEDDSAHTRHVITELTREALTKDGGELIGDSSEMQQLKRELALVAPSDYAILIEGETGVGKELVARTLHEQSNRADGPLVYVNCAAIPENLIESELFGHVKGAFTGADRDRVGKFSLADGGTLFLDEIGELPLVAQSKLLRALQNQEIQPVGRDSISHVDVRVLAATNRILQQEVAAKRFRADLYHRLSVYPVKVPPLRRRHGDVALLAGYFAEQSRRRLGLAQLIIDSQAHQALQAYSWPGNVRELEHVIGRAALIANAEYKQGNKLLSGTQRRVDITCIQCHHLGELVSSFTDPMTLSSFEAEDKISNGEVAGDASSVSLTLALSQGLKESTEQFQQQLILQALTQYEGNWAAAARELKMDRANLVRLAKRLGLQVVKKIHNGNG